VSLPEIPAKVTDWNIDILNKLITFRDIESDVFDFKGSDFSDLAIHLCAMANNGGGTLVLGIDEDKTSEGHLLGFKKIGFSVGKENFMDREVGNRVFQVEPNPKVEIKNIEDTNDKFYIALQIIGEESRKPYMIKDRAQFFVRINGSTRPASRTVVSNLFVNAIQKKMI
jgi:predicted HTH transcriptional regulator